MAACVMMGVCVSSRETTCHLSRQPAAQWPADCCKADEKKKGKKRRQRSSPTLTLKSYVLQEAETVGRKAKLRTATAMGLRVT